MFFGGKYKKKRLAEFEGGYIEYIASRQSYWHTFTMKTSINLCIENFYSVISVIWVVIEEA